MQGLTLVLNPNARKPRLKPPSLDRLKQKLGPLAVVHVTRNLDELDALMRSLPPQEEETICFYGGDGSIACGLTSLVRHQGEDSPLPPILAVRAGTINMLCSILGLHETVSRTLTRWNRGELRDLKSIPLLKVEVEGAEPQYGFVFAWGVGFRVLREYYARSKSPDVRDAMAVLAWAFGAALSPGASESPLFRMVDLRARVDGQPLGVSRVHALTLGTIDRLSLGIRPFPPEPIRPGGFYYSANGMPLWKVAMHSPTLLFGAGDVRRLAKSGTMACGAQVREFECELTEGFTMDGEIFEIQDRARVRVSPGPVVRFWTRHPA